VAWEVLQELSRRQLPLPLRLYMSGNRCAGAAMPVSWAATQAAASPALPFNLNLKFTSDKLCGMPLWDGPLHVVVNVIM
jgi:hypothetical protein